MAPPKEDRKYSMSFTNWALGGSLVNVDQTIAGDDGKPSRRVSSRLAIVVDAEGNKVYTDGTVERRQKPPAPKPEPKPELKEKAKNIEHTCKRGILKKPTEKFVEKEDAPEHLIKCKCGKCGKSIKSQPEFKCKKHSKVEDDPKKEDKAKPKDGDKDESNDESKDEGKENKVDQNDNQDNSSKKQDDNVKKQDNGAKKQKRGKSEFQWTDELDEQLMALYMAKTPWNEILKAMRTNRKTCDARIEFLEKQENNKEDKDEARSPINDTQVSAWSDDPPTTNVKYGQPVGDLVGVGDMGDMGDPFGADFGGDPKKTEEKNGWGAPFDWRKAHLNNNTGIGGGNDMYNVGDMYTAATATAGVNRWSKDSSKPAKDEDIYAAATAAVNYWTKDISKPTEDKDMYTAAVNRWNQSSSKPAKDDGGWNSDNPFAVVPPIDVPPAVPANPSNSWNNESKVAETKKAESATGNATGAGEDWGGVNNYGGGEDWDKKTEEPTPAKSSGGGWNDDNPYAKKSTETKDADIALGGSGIASTEINANPDTNRDAKPDGGDSGAAAGWDTSDNKPAEDWNSKPNSGKSGGDSGCNSSGNQPVSDAEAGSDKNTSQGKAEHADGSGQDASGNSNKKEKGAGKFGGDGACDSGNKTSSGGGGGSWDTPNSNSNSNGQSGNTGSWNNNTSNGGGGGNSWDNSNSNSNWGSNQNTSSGGQNVPSQGGNYGNSSRNQGTSNGANNNPSNNWNNTTKSGGNNGSQGGGGWNDDNPYFNQARHQNQSNWDASSGNGPNGPPNNWGNANLSNGTNVQGSSPPNNGNHNESRPNSWSGNGNNNGGWGGSAPDNFAQQRQGPNNGNWQSGPQNSYNNWQGQPQFARNTQGGYQNGSGGNDQVNGNGGGNWQSYPQNSCSGRQGAPPYANFKQGDQNQHHVGNENHSSHQCSDNCNNGPPNQGNNFQGSSWQSSCPVHGGNGNNLQGRQGQNQSYNGNQGGNWQNGNWNNGQGDNWHNGNWNNGQGNTPPINQGNGAPLNQHPTQSNNWNQNNSWQSNDLPQNNNNGGCWLHGGNNQGVPDFQNNAQGSYWQSTGPAVQQNYQGNRVLSNASLHFPNNNFGNAQGFNNSPALPQNANSMNSPPRSQAQGPVITGQWMWLPSPPQVQPRNVTAGNSPMSASVRSQPENANVDGMWVWQAASLPPVQTSPQMHHRGCVHAHDNNGNGQWAGQSSTGPHWQGQGNTGAAGGHDIWNSQQNNTQMRSPASSHVAPSVFENPFTNPNHPPNFIPVTTPIPTHAPPFKSSSQNFNLPGSFPSTPGPDSAPSSFPTHNHHQNNHHHHHHNHGCTVSPSPSHLSFNQNSSIPEYCDAHRPVSPSPSQLMSDQDCGHPECCEAHRTVSPTPSQLMPDIDFSRTECEVLEHLHGKHTRARFRAMVKDFFHRTGRLLCPRVLEKKFRDDGLV